MKGSALSAAGQSMLSDEDFADSLLLITQRPPSKGDDLFKQRCGVCGTTNTPCWRKGPAGPKTLCNRCGVHWYQNKDRWDLIVEELRATRMDDTVEQASAPTRTVIKKKVDPRGADAHPAVPDSQRCVKSNGRGWRCSQRKVSGYSYCAHHQRNWDGHEKQWRKAFPNLVYPRKSKKAAAAAPDAKDVTVRKRERKPKHPSGGVTLPEKWGRVEFGRNSDEHRTQFGRDSDGSSEPDYVDSRLGKVRVASRSPRGGPANENSGSLMHPVLPSETDELDGERKAYVSDDDDDSQLYHGTQLSEEPGESLESAKEVRSPNRADLQPKQEPSLRSEVTTLSPSLKASHPDLSSERCVMKGGTGWQCPRPRQAGLRHCQYHTEARRAKAASQTGLAEKRGGLDDEETLDGMDILMRLQLKRKRAEEETGNRRGGLAGPGLGLTWKTKMRRRPFSSRGGPVADVKQGSDLSQDSPRPKREIDPPETEWGGRREEEDDAAYLGVEELRRRLEQSQGAVAAQAERNEAARRELMKAREGRLLAEKRLEEAKRGVAGGEDLASVEKLRTAVQAERAIGRALQPEALKLADQFQHQARLLAKQDAHLSDLRTSAEELRRVVAVLTAEKQELQAQLALLQKVNACTLCTSGKSASTALLPCGHVYCAPCSAKLLPQVGGVSALEPAPAADASNTDGLVETAAENGGKVIVEKGGQAVESEGSVRLSRCPCCSVEVQRRLVVQKPAPVDEEMDGAVSLLGLLASESSQ